MPLLKTTRKFHDIDNQKIGESEKVKIGGANGSETEKGWIEKTAEPEKGEIEIAVAEEIEAGVLSGKILEESGVINSGVQTTMVCRPFLVKSAVLVGAHITRTVAAIFTRGKAFVHMEMIVLMHMVQIVL